MKVLLHNPKIEYPVVETDSPYIIDGVDAYKTLCPISKESGIRESPLRMLETLANDPDKKRVLDTILQELPAVKSIGDSLPDNEKFDMLIHRADVGTKYEVQQYIDISRPYIESLLSSPKQEVEPKKDTIKFNDNTDDNSSES